MHNTTTTAPALKEYCVWADSRVYQHVEAASPEDAYRLAQEHPENFEPCSNHADNFSLDPVVTLTSIDEMPSDTSDEFLVGPPRPEDPVKAELLAACKQMLVLYREGIERDEPIDAADFLDDFLATRPVLLDAIAKAEGR